MTGNPRAGLSRGSGGKNGYEIFSTETMPNYFRYFHRDGYDLYLVTDEALNLANQDPNNLILLTERDWTAAAERCGGTLKKVDLSVPRVRRERERERENMIRYLDYSSVSCIDIFPKLSTFSS